MESVVLRPYQLECIEATWSDLFQSSSVLTVLPTGAGKTVIFGELIRKAIEAKPDIRIVVLMGRIDLVSQTERAIARQVPRRDIGVYCGSLGRKELSRKVTLASIQSIHRERLRPNLIICDEVHNFDARGGRYLKFIEQCLADNPKLKVVGFTATPFRMNGEIYGEDEFFKKITYRKRIQDLIALGHLCEPRMKGSKEQFDISSLRIKGGEYVQGDVDELVKDQDQCSRQILDALSRMDGRQCIVWATANIDHCNLVANALMAMAERVTTVHSKLEKETRNANLSAFRGGSCRHMVFVTILSEGFDHPPIDTVVLMRPTRSPVLYVQSVGRGLRPSADTGKRDCLVLDYGQVIRTLGPLDNPRVKRKKKNDEKDEAPIKECPQCLSFVFAGLRVCPCCGFQFPPPPEPAEKLERKSDERAKILSEQAAPETLVTGPAVIAMHESKNGNQCVRITYKDPCLVATWGFSGISEFFVTTSPWAMERMQRRITVLGSGPPSIPFDGEVVVRGTFEVVKSREGKYDRLLSVRRVSDDLPPGSARNDSMSFEFGANEPIRQSKDKPEDWL